MGAIAWRRRRILIESLLLSHLLMRRSRHILATSITISCSVVAIPGRLHLRIHLWVYLRLHLMGRYGRGPTLFFCLALWQMAETHLTREHHLLLGILLFLLG